MYGTHSSAANPYQEMLRRAYGLHRPATDYTVSQWAIANRFLPEGTTARPGKFIPEVYQVEMMDAITNPLVHRVSVMKSTQIGYSDGVLDNIIGYHIDARPQPMMMVQPTIETAENFSLTRVQPMIEACPVIRARIHAATSRRGGNSMLHKEFPGGYLKITGANAAAGLRSDPVPVVLGDEIDAYPLDVGGEGDPISIATRRTDTFSNWKIYLGSTPAKPKGVSPIEKYYLASDMRRFHVPCPFCGFRQVLAWRDRVNTKQYRVTYELDLNGEVVRDTVAYICAGCKERIPERFKRTMLNAGRWIAEKPDRPDVGFHINGLYSPWRDETWEEMAQEWVKANREGNPELLKAFINLRLGETWEEDGDAVEAHQLRARCEVYSAKEEVQVPLGVGLLTAAVDVQGDRLECVVKGWGAKEESWLVAYTQFYGDPGDPGRVTNVWGELDEFLMTEFLCEKGQRIRIRSTMIDSGGAHAAQVYSFVKVRQNRRIWACKGGSETGKEILGKPSVNNQYKVRLFILGTDTAKDRIYARMKIPKAGPAFMHLPDWIDDEYLAQLTGEKAVRKYKKGRGAVREYIKTRTRNEALDLEVYNLAAFYSLGPQAAATAATLAAQLAEGKPDAVPAGSQRRMRNPGIT